MRTILATAILLGPSLGFAAATPTGEFVGDAFVDWEDHPGGFPVCYGLDSAEICSEGGGIHGTTGWGYVCSMSPYGGSKIMGNNGSGTTITFDSPVDHFGGYWGTNSGDASVATFTFYNGAGEVVASEDVSFDVCSEWYWAGWTFDEGVSSMRIDYAPTHLMSENLTYSFGDGVGGSSVAVRHEGDCPGPVRIEINGTPGANFALFAGDMEGSTPMPGALGDGVDLGVEASSGVLWKKFLPDRDGDGVISMSPDLPDLVCDMKWVAVDMSTCDVSSVQQFTSPIAPNPECSEYTELSDAFRNVGWGYDYARCDSGLAAGWYRFTGDAGTQMLDYAPGDFNCGTHAPGWIDGHPAFVGDTTRQTVCYDWSGDGDDCTWSNEVDVTNCGDFYVYNLVAPPVCSLAYCGM